MGAYFTKVFENNIIHTLHLYSMGNQFFHILFEIYVTFYPTVDRNEYTYFIKLAFYFLFFPIN